MDFVLPGLLSGSVGTLVGPGGIGKTMFELQLAVLLAAGLGAHDPLFGADHGGCFTAEPKKVLLIAAEEPVEVLWRRLHAIIHSLKLRNVLPEGMSWQVFSERISTHLHLYPLAAARRVNLLTSDLTPSESALELGELAKGARLVVVDPLRQLHVGDENQSAPMSALMSVFKQLAQQSGAAVLIAHHSSRAAGLQGYDDTADAGRGSTALKDDARWQLNLVPPSRQLLAAHGLSSGEASDHVMLVDAKNNYGKKRARVLLCRTSEGVLVPVFQREKVACKSKPRNSRVNKEAA